MYFQVEASDETTKICENCVGEVHHCTRFREVCAATDHKMKRSRRLRSESGNGVIGETVGTLQNANTDNGSNGINWRNRAWSTDPPVAFISLIDDESDEETHQPNIEPETTNNGPPARLDTESVAIAKRTKIKTNSIDFET